MGIHRSCTKVVMMDIVGIVVSFHHPGRAAEGHRSWLGALSELGGGVHSERCF